MVFLPDVIIPVRIRTGIGSKDVCNVITLRDCVLALRAGAMSTDADVLVRKNLDGGREAGEGG
ncbi:hypothetical protein, partial [Agrobacterium tumefaciens]|uniref:hypothetical protein n=1 Tax=Agrobacterium tumefaciens TaxID=358 RepID=UPI001BAA38F1